MKGRITVAGVILAAVILLGVVLTPGPVIGLQTEDGDAVVCRPLAIGDSVTLIFQHSMYGGDVRETYQITSTNGLMRTSMTTDNAAAAEYYAWDGRIAPDPAGYRVVVEPETYESITIRPNHIGQHRLRIQGETLALTDDIKQPVGTTMRVERAPLIIRLLAPSAAC